MVNSDSGLYFLTIRPVPYLPPNSFARGVGRSAEQKEKKNSKNPIQPKCHECNFVCHSTSIARSSVISIDKISKNKFRFSCTYPRHRRIHRICHRFAVAVQSHRNTIHDRYNWVALRNRIEMPSSGLAVRSIDHDHYSRLTHDRRL